MHQVTNFSLQTPLTYVVDIEFLPQVREHGVQLVALVLQVVILILQALLVEGTGGIQLQVLLRKVDDSRRHRRLLLQLLVV